MGKVVPANAVGPTYFGEVKGPFGDLRLLACGGVSAENLAACARGGADAFAFGASVFRSDWIAAGEYARIGQGISDLVDAYDDAVGKQG